MVTNFNNDLLTERDILVYFRVNFLNLLGYC